jgi:hypothetical protein
MASFRIYQDRNAWRAGNATKEAESLASAKATATAFDCTHISASDGRTWHFAAGAWRRA